MEPLRFVGFVWEGVVLHISEPIELGPHEHSAVELTLGLDKPVAVDSDAGGRARGDCVVVGSNVTHALRGGHHATLWIEPESDAGRRLTAAYLADEGTVAVPLPDAKSLAERAEEILADPSSCDIAWELVQDWLAAATRTLPRPPVVHPAIRRALRVIRARPRFKISAKELAADVELSEGHFMDLFREHMGMPLRRFLMWQRVREAAFRLARGAAVSDIAYEVGFADAAHLTRTFKRMLALRPSELKNAPPARLHVCSRPL